MIGMMWRSIFSKMLVLNATPLCLTRVASSLPHGYLKRLELARCLALRPDLLILDELFSGMSMSEVASTLPIIEKLNAEKVSASSWLSTD